MEYNVSFNIYIMLYIIIYIYLQKQLQWFVSFLLKEVKKIVIHIFFSYDVLFRLT